jgi:hypothetical protein
VPALAVVFDADVLFGIEVTDVLLTIATKRLFRAHWSNEIIDEFRRNLIERPGIRPEAIDYRIAQMNRALPDALVDPPDSLVEAMPVNSKDRHVLALAVHLSAPILVTNNLKHFPADVCDEFGVEAMTPDTFLALQVDLDPDLVVSALDEIAARRQRPPRTRHELLDRLESVLPTTVSLMREHLRTN